jgi:hypothetical protein
MGLDQYAYVAARANQRSDYYNTGDWDSDSKEYVNANVENPREIAYWRKHPNLQGWMETLWRSRNTDPSEDPAFNGVELELTWEDLDQLEKDIRDDQLPYTQGFFFGEPSDDYYKQQDLDFIKNARAELFLGLKVFYNSSW